MIIVWVKFLMKYIFISLIALKFILSALFSKLIIGNKLYTYDRMGLGYLCTVPHIIIMQLA